MQSSLFSFFTPNAGAQAAAAKAKKAQKAASAAAAATAAAKATKAAAAAEKQVASRKRAPQQQPATSPSQQRRRLEGPAATEANTSTSAAGLPQSSSSSAAPKRAKRSRTIAVSDDEDDEEDDAAAGGGGGLLNSGSESEFIAPDEEEEEEDDDEEEWASSASDVPIKRARPLIQSRKKQRASTAASAPPAAAAPRPIPASSRTVPSAFSGELNRFAATSEDAVAAPVGARPEIIDHANDDDGNDDDDAGTPAKGVLLERGQHYHNTLPWLTKAKRRDAKGRKASDPDFDPRTLTLPKPKSKFDFKRTPAQEQWWEFKAQNMDAIVMFKVGKFYEIFHMDADAAVAALPGQLAYMKGASAHVGFPEIAFHKFSASLVARGFRVARAEQTETPAMLKERNAARKRRGLNNAKVVLREICSMLTPGTRTLSTLEIFDPSDDNVQLNPAPLLALFRVDDEAATVDAADASSCDCSYGVAVIDAARGVVTVGSFRDNERRSQLEMLMMHYHPAEVLHLRGNLDSLAKHVLTGAEGVQAVSEVPCSSKAAWSLRSAIATLSDPAMLDAPASWPAFIAPLASDAAAAHVPARALGAALGGCLDYLKRCHCANVIVTQRKFVPIRFHGGSDDTDVAGAASNAASVAAAAAAASPRFDPRAWEHQARLILDSAALRNLDILQTESGKVKGSLLGLLDCCKSPFGKRLLRRWVVAPSAVAATIGHRLDAVDELMGNSDLLDLARGVLSEVKVSSSRHLSKQMEKNRSSSSSSSSSSSASSARGGSKKGSRMPDLERICARVHIQGSKYRSKSGGHPDGRAIMYENALYDKRNITAFLTALDGLQQLCKIGPLFAKECGDDLASRSALLAALTVDAASGSDELGLWTKVSDQIENFHGMFDRSKAAKEGTIEPQPGTDAEFDGANRAVTEVNEDFKTYLATQKREYGCNMIYFGTKPKRQIEIKDNTNFEAPEDWHVTSRKKGSTRFHTPEIEAMLERLVSAETAMASARADTSRRLFARFASHQELWTAAIACAAQLDCILALAVASMSGDGRGAMCRPEIESAGGVSDAAAPEATGFIDLRGMRHPCVLDTYGGGEFIPNDTVLGNAEKDASGTPRCLLLTGPNMGGKSTLLRQTCMAVVMAQIGCYVPADSLRFTLFDRIFTRVGANDRIMAGESTFLVELRETVEILEHATNRSLVIMDELGRGTSTFDGAAIACAVLRSLVRDTHCCTLFSTHYHAVVEEFLHDDGVALGHMVCSSLSSLSLSPFLCQARNKSLSFSLPLSFVLPPAQNCYVETAEASEDSEEVPVQRVTFLYTLAEGVCPNSYGINVARLARLPDSLVRKAARMSKQLAGVHAAAAAASSEVGVLEGIEAELRLVVERSDNAALTSLWRRARAALAAK